MKQVNNQPGDLAEQAGNTVAATALQAMRNAPTQAVRSAILINALRDICDSPDEPDRAIDGFASGLIAVVDRGLDMPTSQDP